jgi:hypothetical protein
VGWNGGLNPTNITWESPTPTQRYEGKFCLQKAAFKALSRNGCWELIEPYDAFTAEIWKGDQTNTFVMFLNSEYGFVVSVPITNSLKQFSLQIAKMS